MNKIGKWLVCIGILLIVLALFEYTKDSYEDYSASKSSEEALEEITDYIINTNDEVKIEELSSTNKNIEENYIGIITIPDINIELPVYNNWSYDNLRKAPAVYYGSISENNLVICGHSYRSHFKKLNKLKSGNTIVITDINNNKYVYQVVMSEVINPYDSDEMVESEFDLTIFSCYNGGTERIAIRANIIK